MNRPEIEDLLCNLHTGSWYGWTAPNNKVYENLFVHSDHYPGIEKPTKEFLDSELALMQSEYDSQAYARNRATAYASTGDQLDMQYWDSVNDTTTWKDHIASVKAQFPKV